MTLDINIVPWYMEILGKPVWSNILNNSQALALDEVFLKGITTDLPNYVFLC